MKKSIIILFIYFIGMFVHGQMFNDGYYYGLINDSINNKYIFMSFISSDDDDILYIVPYINDDIDSVFMHNNFLELLKQERKDSIDGNIFIEKTWTISGFDNYPYYTINKNIITFSLNIANITSRYLDVFEFKGVILNEGKTIESIISSTDSTFNKSILILNYKKIKK